MAKPMSSVTYEGIESRKGIKNTLEWQLIHSIKKMGHRCQSVTEPEKKFDKKGKLCAKINNEIDKLNRAILKTFTIIDFEIILQRESEWPDENHPEDSKDICEAKRYLHDLCSLLDLRANIALISPANTSLQHEGGMRFPSLTRLVEHFEPISGIPPKFDLIPSPGSMARPYLFNITDNSDRAIAFSALRDPNLELPDADTCHLIIRDVELMEEHIRKFNMFVASLKLTEQSLDDLAEQPIEKPGSQQYSVSLIALQTFWSKVFSTFHSAFSQFARCDNSHETSDHEILLQMPFIDDEFRLCVSDVREDVPVRIFFKTCVIKEWQRADVNFTPSQSRDMYGRQSLCDALQEAYCSSTHLQLGVSHSTARDGTIQVALVVPKSINQNPGEPEHCKSPNQAAHSLLSLIRSKYFELSDTFELLKSTKYNGAVVNVDRRKSLAIKAALGLILSMDCVGSICTWDSERMYSFLPVRESNNKESYVTDFPVFVSIKESHKGGGNREQEGLSLSRWKQSCWAGTTDRLQPLPPFIYLAKVLMQIAKGETLDGLTISSDAKTITEARRQMQDYINLSVKEMNPKTTPFLRAASACLKFHLTYWDHAETEPADHYILRAWRLMFEHVISTIDQRFTLADSQSDWVGESLLHLRELPAPVTAIPVNQTLVESSGGVGSVVLFDGGTSSATTSTIETARGFFKHLEEFNSSYNDPKVAIQRTTENEVESPKRIRIAILDTGIDFKFPGLTFARRKGRVRPEWCRSWVGKEDAIDDKDNGLHGTNCAYLLHKAAPEADIYIAKVCAGNIFNIDEATNIEKAINHAVNDWKVDIISMSFGLRPLLPCKGMTERDYIENSLSYAKIRDDIETAITKASGSTIIFAAASNSGGNMGRAFPANLDPHGLICVNASDGLGNPSGINPPLEKNSYNFMTLGKDVELFEKCLVDDGFKYNQVHKSGTSFATPIAAGIAGAVLDLELRATSVEERTQTKLKSLRGMKTCMSQHFTHDMGGYRFIAPWIHWKEGWQSDAKLTATTLGMIDLLFKQ